MTAWHAVFPGAATIHRIETGNRTVSFEGEAVAGSFVVYIDESGDEGFRFSEGSTEWFILSAVVTRQENDLETVKLIDGVRQELKMPERKEVHFRNLTHEKKVLLINRIANARLRCVSVLIHKPSLNEPENFQQGYRLYFYAVRFLLERVSWLCRNHRKSEDCGDGSARLVFSNRAAMPYQELRKYLDILKDGGSEHDCRIDWSVIKTDQLTAAIARSMMGLQIVDAVAGAFFHAITPSIYGLTEDRYARMIRSVVYKSGGAYRGYGVKIWPREADELAKTDGRFAWFRDHYK